MRDLKTAVVTLLLTASLAAGCTGNNPEEDLDAKYQEGYDAGYGDAYDASYDGMAQHQYNEGWDDGWGVANTDSQAEIAEIQATVSGLEAAIALMEDQRDSLLALLSDSQEFANQTLELAEAMNATIAALHVMLGENATQVLQLQIDVHEWQQTAESNRAVINSELTGVADGPRTLIHDSKLRNADFRELQMRHLRWIDGNFSGANISSADIYEVAFSSVDLQGVDFSYTDFVSVDIIGTNLQGVDFRSAFLVNVDFVDSDLNGADLTDISHLGVTWANTICPDGTNSNDNGNTCVNNL